MSSKVISNFLLAKAISSLGNEGFHEAFSSYISSHIEYDNLIIIVYKNENNPLVLHKECKDPIVYHDMDTEYINGSYVLDPFYQLHLKGAEDGFRRLADVAPDQFKRTSYYKKYYKNTTLIDEIAIFSRISTDTTITACFGRDRTSRALFSKKDIFSFSAISLISSALLQQHWKDKHFSDGETDEKLPLEKRLQLAIAEEKGIDLSPRQTEVALLILQGHSSLSISLHLGISQETVKVFRRQLYSKCKISSQAQLFTMMLPLLSTIAN